MVKHATKFEKAGSSLKQLFNDVIGLVSKEDNLKSKIRSLVVKSLAGRLDIGIKNCYLKSYRQVDIQVKRLSLLFY